MNTKKIEFWLQKWSQNCAKKSGCRSLFWLPKNCFDFFIVFRQVLPPPGFPLAPFWLLFAPFGLHFGSLWPPLGSLLVLFVILWLPLGFLGVVRASKVFLRQRKRNCGEILPRSCRDSAENVPRICQEPAKNPPYEPQTKLPFKLQVLRNDFVRRQTLSQNRPEQNVGRRWLLDTTGQKSIRGD